MRSRSARAQQDADAARAEAATAEAETATLAKEIALLEAPKTAMVVAYDWLVVLL